MNTLSYAQGSILIVVAQTGIALIAAILSSKFSDMSLHKQSFILEPTSDISRALKVKKLDVGRTYYFKTFGLLETTERYNGDLFRRRIH